MNEEHGQVSPSVGLTESDVEILAFALSIFHKSELWPGVKYFFNLVGFNVMLEGKFVTTVLSQMMPSMIMN